MSEPHDDAALALNTLEELSDEALMRVLVRRHPQYAGLEAYIPKARHNKKRNVDDIPDLAGLPQGQSRAVQAWPEPP